MKEQILTHIGAKEIVSFPGANISDVPAKIDTGADFSSVWASNITEQDGALSFSLFGKGSKYYTGAVITTDTYGMTEVRNSFGHSEHRYKVKLTVVVGGKRISAEFRLADRSSNTSPVLIGKKTLSKRFIVDVSRDNATSRGKQGKILVLNSKPSVTVGKFFDSINAYSKDITCDFHLYDDLTLILDSRNGIEVVHARTHEPIDTYDLIYFKTYFAKAEVAAALSEYAQMRGIHFIDSEVASYRAVTKVSQYARLARFGVQVPKTLVISPMVLKGEFSWIKEVLGVPFILKDAAADKGESNYLINDEKQFIKAAAIAKKQGAYYIAQQFIPNDGDYRVIVLDKSIDLVIGRQKTSAKTHLNNTSTGARATIIDKKDLPSAALKMAVEAAIITKREVAGVDIIKDSKTGEWLVLEVNNSPQLASGSYPEEKIKVFEAFLKKQADK